MDNLARNAMLAKQAGMSYGKWKAMQQAAPIVKTETIPEGWIKCAYCGKPFKPRTSQKFCSTECREEAYADRLREQQKAYRERRKAGVGNG